ncbi:30S ribosomal protein S2, partial [Acidobacteriota bacterium]
NRWLGGTLTNYVTIKKNIKHLKELETQRADGTLDNLTKKERSRMERIYNKLNKLLGGIKNMDKLPDAVFIIDPRREKNAVLEARKLGLPVIAVVDTNCDPSDIDFVIPGNDDAIRAIRLFTSRIADAVLEGTEVHEKRTSVEEAVEKEAKEPQQESAEEQQAKDAAPKKR